MCHNCSLEGLDANFSSLSAMFKRWVNMSFTLYGHAKIQLEYVGMCVCACERQCVFQ